MQLSRREALLKLLKEKQIIGYIPFSTYGIDRYSHPWMAEDRSYNEVLKYTDKYDHIQVLWLSYWWSFGLTDILEVADPDMKEAKIYEKDNITYYEYILHTPIKILTAKYKKIPGNMSIWRNDNLIKTDKDIDAFLATEFKPKIPDIKKYKEILKELDDSGIIQVQVPNPVALILENMDYADFLLHVSTTPSKIEALLEKAQQLILQWLAPILQSGIGESFRICGAEYCTPPMTSPEFYHHAVTEFDKPIVKMIQKAGRIVQYHCHGQIKKVLNEFLELGVDAIDPCESPPHGDITLREIASYIGNSLVIMGNIQLGLLENSSPKEIEKLVAKVIDEIGDKVPFLLMPTSSPFVRPLPKKMSDNIIAFINSAIKYGGYK